MEVVDGTKLVGKVHQAGGSYQKNSSSNIFLSVGTLLQSEGTFIVCGNAFLSMGMLFCGNTFCLWEHLGMLFCLWECFICYVVMLLLSLETLFVCGSAFLCVRVLCCLWGWLLW
jgi:hypothetical protein